VEYLEKEKYSLQSACHSMTKQIEYRMMVLQLSDSSVITSSGLTEKSFELISLLPVGTEEEELYHQLQSDCLFRSPKSAVFSISRFFHFHF